MPEPVEKKRISKAGEENLCGPVWLVSYRAEQKGHMFWVNDQKKLPEAAVGVRVPTDSPLQAALLYAFDKKVPVFVIPANRWAGPGAKLFWTIAAVQLGSQL